jgi:hypothetical protein
MLPLHFAMIRRYAPKLAWPIYLATECVDHPVVKQIALDYDVKILRIPPEQGGFLDSRWAACVALPPEIKYILPMQEDFLLDRTPDYEAIVESLQILESNPDVASMRYMPCPGPAKMDRPFFSEKTPVFNYNQPLRWRKLDPENNTYMYSFQATMWRRSDFFDWYFALRQFRDDRLNGRELTMQERIRFEVRTNIAENAEGQGLFQIVLGEKKHLAWERQFKHPNGVYFSPWPYRPTAIVGGVLQPWAKELAEREGMPMQAFLGGAGPQREGMPMQAFLGGAGPQEPRVPSK